MLHVCLPPCPILYPLPPHSTNIKKMHIKNHVKKCLLNWQTFKSENLKIQKTAKFVSKEGEAGEAIVAIAEREKANLIVTGTRGMGKLRRTFLGSVSDYVIHHSKCPVLVCRK